MSRINPDVLRAEREKREWSLEDLARHSRIHAQSIHRIEKGDQQRNRKDVIEQLARALGISEDALTNAAVRSVSEKGVNEIDELLLSSQLNLRVSNRTRNALSLIANRYGVAHAQVIEIAPLLFCWAAERSLKQRKDLLGEIETRIEEFRQLRPPHLHAAAFASQRSEGTLEAERQSVESNDLFGELINGDGYESFLPDGYAEGAKNPFAMFLRRLSDELGDLADFEEWEPGSSPVYSVCRSKAVELMAGDDYAANEILDGSVPLHKIPKELREKGKGEDRAKWVHDEVAARQSKYFKDIDLTESGT